MGGMAFLFLVWGVIASFYSHITDWMQNEWSNFILGLFFVIGFILTMYWWRVKAQRRRLEIELEDMSAQLSCRIRQIETQKAEQKMKMHVAGMVIDDLLRLKASLDRKYQAMKAYVGNLSVWYKEEVKDLETMEPLVKDPFIPLLSTPKLYSYFEENKEKITKDMHLYDYFNEFKLDDESIIKYKCRLKQNILDHIKTLLNGFTIFRHIFATIDYPFVDKKYASAENLLPLLDAKSDPFCQIKRLADSTQQARILFIHTDSGEEQAWNASYPKHFNMRPLSVNISSVFKIIGLRLQVLKFEEVILD